MNILWRGARGPAVKERNVIVFLWNVTKIGSEFFSKYSLVNVYRLILTC